MGLGSIFKSIFGVGKVDVFARYEILREAISGTMSNFYKARDRETGEIVGLKILDRQQTEQLEARFRGLNKPSEGEIAVTFEHPSIVKTFEHGITKRGEQFLVMEYLEGPGLNSLIIAKSEDLEGRRLPLVRQAAESLRAVHEAGYIHRDVCPRNFVVAPDTLSLKLIDFGLTVPATKPFMQPGVRTGTPRYMAPEVVRRRATDVRVDIFSFGVTAYEMLTFQLPWPGVVDGQSAMVHGTVPPTPIEEYRSTVDPDLARTVMRCLEADAARRPQSMEQFLQLIRNVEHEDASGAADRTARGDSHEAS